MPTYYELNQSSEIQETIEEFDIINSRFLWVNNLLSICSTEEEFDFDYKNSMNCQTLS